MLSQQMMMKWTAPQIYRNVPSQITTKATKNTDVVVGISYLLNLDSETNEEESLAVGKAGPTYDDGVRPGTYIKAISNISSCNYFTSTSGTHHSWPRKKQIETC